MNELQYDPIINVRFNRTFIAEMLPQGAGALSLIQMFAVSGYAVLFSTLILFATKSLHLNIILATGIMGSFAGLHSCLHIMGGCLGRRFISWRILLIMGMMFQLSGCLFLATLKLGGFYWGLSIFLLGSGLVPISINMMMTQLFQPEDKRRETAFMWNYSILNIGFFLGYSIAGFFQLQENYHELFLVSSFFESIAIVITVHP